MKLNVLLVEDFPHPMEKVWRALTDPDALRVWLMDNDFEPRAGKRFILRGRRVPPGSRGWHECEVLEIEPPCRMVWSWIINEGDTPTRVEFRLEEIGPGTRLTLSHTGEVDPITRSRLTEGWPEKLAELDALLSRTI
ncbi:MAG: SRPBCC domain-containing protein [Deltaproteobacteria bacterium]|nr:SRPBCC domain-containing protein [Deltaproteobacteria bacterium]